jgi:predicted RNase H-like HicB family nuclease
MTKRFKIIVQRTPEGYVAYPIGLRGVVVSDGETFEEAVANVKQAIAFHIETFGEDVLEDLAPPEDLTVMETEVVLDV